MTRISKQLVSFGLNLSCCYFVVFLATQLDIDYLERLNPTANNEVWSLLLFAIYKIFIV